MLALANEAQRAFSIGCLEYDLLVSRVLGWKWKTGSPTQPVPGSSRVGLLPRGLSRPDDLFREKTRAPRQCQIRWELALWATLQ